MPAQDLGPEAIKDPLTLFSYLVEIGGKVLLTAPEPHSGLVRLGFVVDETGKDLRLIRLEPENLEAIWWSNANDRYSIEDAFRILQIFFKALRPKKGILVFSFKKECPDGIWEVKTVMTLLRQTGLNFVHSFENPREHLYFCQRI